MYTDMLSVMFPVLFFYLYLNSKEQSGKKKNNYIYINGTDNYNRKFE